MTLQTANGAATGDGLRIAPTISGFSPDRGAPGTVVHITGTGLRSVASWSVGGDLGDRANMSAASDGTGLDIGIPVHLTSTASGPIGISGPGGSAQTATPFYYFYISGLNPAVAGPGAAVTLNGFGLGDASAVTVDDHPASFSYVGGNLSMVVPDDATSGPVRVTTPLGTAVSPYNLTITEVDGFTPTSGPPGTHIVLTGKGLQSLTIDRVTMGGDGQEVPFTVDSDVQMTLTVTNFALTGPIKLWTNKGTIQVPGTFTITSG